MNAEAFAPVATVERSGVVEGLHHGAVVVLGPGGAPLAAAGDPGVAVYARSAMKPLQAAAMLAAGLDVPAEQLALVCASHDGSPRHVAVVRSILADAGVDETVLETTPGLPLDPASADAVIREGGGPQPLTMNCSGKHAGMIATCVSAGWRVGGHLEPDHPLQVHITDSIVAMTGGVSHVGVDGCGAPAHVVRLVDLATAISTLALEGGRVARAMTAHPDLVGGPARPVTVLMRAVNGLVAKDGAEGVFVAAMPDGRTVAVKIADGARRAVIPVVVDALRSVGVDVGPSPDLTQHVLGHGLPVGEVRSVLADVAVPYSGRP